MRSEYSIGRLSISGRWMEGCDWGSAVVARDLSGKVS